jgi:hypothetical protein
MMVSPTYALANLVAGAQLGLSGFPDLAAGQALPRYLRLLVDGWHGDDDCWSGYCGYRHRSSA